MNRREYETRRARVAALAAGCIILACAIAMHLIVGAR